MAEMAEKGHESLLPEGIHSLLDTDLYKLTMQAALLQHYPNIGSFYKSKEIANAIQTSLTSSLIAAST